LKIKRERVDASIERRILIGMITNTQFLGRMVPLLKELSLLELPYGRTVARWCLSHYKRYKKAPGRHVQDLYNAAIRRGMREEEEELLGEFVASLSKEYAQGELLNVDYLTDEAKEFVNGRAIAILMEDVGAELTHGNTRAAEARLSLHKKLGPPDVAGVNPLLDKDVVIDALDNVEEDDLISFPGAFGKLLESQLGRESLIGIQAPEKRGKTMLLIEFTIRALAARRNTVYLSVGDMSQKQVTRRFHARVSGKHWLRKYCADLLVPVLDCCYNQKNTCELSCRTCTKGLDIHVPEDDDENEEKDTDEQFTPEELFDSAPRGYTPCSVCAARGRDTFAGAVFYRLRKQVDPLTWREGLRNARKFLTRFRGRDFKLECYPNASVNVKDIRDQLDIWEDVEGFVPDVIVLDYADNLGPEDKRKEFRHQQNETWQMLRALSMDKHCLVVTASQASIAAHKAVSQTMEHFSEDKRKYAHTTGTLALNQTGEEKKQGLLRVGWLVLREGLYHTDEEVTILQCHQIGRPLIASYH